VWQCISRSVGVYIFVTFWEENCLVSGL